MVHSYAFLRGEPSMKIPKMRWQLKAGLTVAALLALIRFGLVPLYDWREETLQKVQALKQSIAVKKALVGKKTDLQGLLH